MILGGTRVRADKVIKCKDCGADFVFTENEQAFYKEKGFDNEPVRCPECRKARKKTRGDHGNSHRRDSGRSGAKKSGQILISADKKNKILNVFQEDAVKPASGLV